MLLALKLALVAASVMAASLVSRRFGHAVGGTLAGLPVIAGPIMGFLLLAGTPAQVRSIALSTLVCLPASVLHMTCFAWAGTRWKWPAAFMAANSVFLLAGAVLLSHPAPAPSACALAIAVTVIGVRLMPRLPPVPGRVAVPRVELALRVAAAVAMAFAIIRSAQTLPTAFSGLLLAVPIAGNVLPCFTLPRHGAAATVALLAGFVRGLLGFACFFTTLVALLPGVSAAVAYAAAWFAALAVVGAMQWSRQWGRRKAISVPARH